MTLTHAPRNGPPPSRLPKAAVRWGLAGLILLVWSYALFGGEGILTQRQHRRELKVLEARVAEARERNEALAAEVEGLKSDDFVIERAIRTELDYQRPGEIVLIVGNDDPMAVVEDGSGGGDASAPPRGGQGAPTKVARSALE